MDAVDSPDQDLSNLVIFPDQAVILSIRNDRNDSLSFMGTASVVPSYWDLPEVGKRTPLQSSFFKYKTLGLNSQPRDHRG